MPIDAESPEGRLFVRLSRRLMWRQARLQRLAAYYEGHPPLPEGITRLRDVAHDFFNTSRTNFAELIAEAPRERMQPVGIRTAADDGESGDLAAWAAWRTAGLQVISADVHQNMLVLGDGYVIVGWDNVWKRPVVTAEDPRQVITEHDPMNHRRVTSALKMFHDSQNQRDLAFLYLPGRVFVASRINKMGRELATLNIGEWEWEPDLSGALPDGLGDVVPVIRFRNHHVTPDGEGVGEFERHIDVLDRINRMILRRIVIATYQAFRQRAVQGDLPEKDEDGNPIDYDKLLEAGPDAMWILPADVKIWESGQVNLQDILSAVKDDVLFLAAVTRTPLSMLTPDAAAQSAEGASLQREGLVFRTEDRIARAEDGWAQVVSLMFRFMGDTTRGDIEKVNILWAPVERYSLAEMSSAWSQFIGLPFETKLRTVLRASPDEIKRIKTEQQDDQFQLLLAEQAAAQQKAPAGLQVDPGAAPMPHGTPPPATAPPTQGA